jgi:mitotic-spindle organizing protein 1
MEMSNLLNTGLDADTLAICVRLCENGVNPEALAMVIQELRRASATLKVCLASACKPCVAQNLADCCDSYSSFLWSIVQL